MMNRRFRTDLNFATSWRLRVSLGAALALGLPACEADDGDGGDDAAASETGDPMATGDEPTADESGGAQAFLPIQTIIDANCSCHTGGAGGLTMGPDAYDGIVGVMATGADLAYIEPGDTAASYLVHKLRGTHATVGGGGGQMPVGGMLTEDDIVTIEDWVNAGAPR